MRNVTVKKIGALFLSLVICMTVVMRVEAAENDYPYLYIYGQVSEENFNGFDKHLQVLLEKCPELMKSFEEDGWTIILTSEDLDELLFHGTTDDVYGCTSVKKKVIFVEAGGYSGCIIHEMGHFLDQKNGLISKKSDFRSIYKKEKKNLAGYGQSTASEFFAEVFAQSILDEDSIEKSCPKAYEFLDDLK